ncbi:hypothetical protein [Pedobacter antarcticus]|uniref:hypothetical protein n=1 Tax=Pedobacter antarcticus TaxID=34086 RepID=UPI00292DB76C|nr:hypothetical protein [Pedobacter antarcticus]
MSTTTAISNINVEEISTTMENAGLILVANETFADKAVKGATQILDTIEGQGMSEELDAAANEWQVKAKQAIKILNERRSPITQMMTKLAGLFTAQEGKLDPKKSDSVYAKIQTARDQWATFKANEQRKKEQEILKQQNIAKERISIKADIQNHIRSIFNQKLSAFKTDIQKKYNLLTLENVTEITEYIKARPLIYPIANFRLIQPPVFTAYIDQAEADQIIYDEREKLYDELAAVFHENIEAEKSNTLELIPSRILELKEIAKAGAQEKARLEKAAEDRRKADELRLKKEQEDQEVKDKAAVQNTVALETAGSLFDTTAALAEVKETTGKSKASEKINVLSTDGWGAIFIFFFEKEGKGLSVDDFGKKTLNQMKAFAEKNNNKSGEKIDNPFIEYVEEVKAVTSKVA